MKITHKPQKQIDQCLSFQLTSQLQAMLPAEQLSEILTLAPSQIVPIFNMSRAIMGVFNRRGEVLWIVDLACFLELEPLYSQDYRHLYSVMVINTENKVAGLAVSQVGQLVMCNKLQIKPSSVQETMPKLSLCSNGEKRNPNGKPILVLDGAKILDLLSSN